MGAQTVLLKRKISAELIWYRFFYLFWSFVDLTDWLTGGEGRLTHIYSHQWIWNAHATNKTINELKQTSVSKLRPILEAVGNDIRTLTLKIKFIECLLLSIFSLLVFSLPYCVLILKSKIKTKMKQKSQHIEHREIGWWLWQAETVNAQYFMYPDRPHMTHSQCFWVVRDFQMHVFDRLLPETTH